MLKVSEIFIPHWVAEWNSGVSSQDNKGGKTDKIIYIRIRKLLAIWYRYY